MTSKQSKKTQGKKGGFFKRLLTLLAVLCVVLAVVVLTTMEDGQHFAALRRWLIDNELEIWRRDQPITALPVLILLLLLCCAPWVTIPILILGLFLGFRYRFSGPDLERESLNNMMGSVADTAADLGHKVMDELKHDWHSDEKDQK